MISGVLLFLCHFKIPFTNSNLVVYLRTQFFTKQNTIKNKYQLIPRIKGAVHYREKTRFKKQKQTCCHENVLHTKNGLKMKNSEQ